MEIQEIDQGSVSKGLEGKPFYLVHKVPGSFTCCRTPDGATLKLRGPRAAIPLCPAYTPADGELWTHKAVVTNGEFSGYEGYWYTEVEPKAP